MYSMDNDIDHILCDGYIHGEMREFCMPMNHPVSPYSPSMAGAPQMQIWK